MRCLRRARLSKHGQGGRGRAAEFPPTKSGVVPPYGLAHERATLIGAGREDLARRIRWASVEDGDGAGYDIASFRPDGGERLIEVKTTNGWGRTPFHISRNELNVAEQRRDVWCLLRIWNFSREAKAFELHPPLDAHVSLTATTFRAGFQ